MTVSSMFAAPIMSEIKHVSVDAGRKICSLVLLITSIAKLMLKTWI